MIEKILERLTNEVLESSSAQTEAIIGMQGASANFYSGEKSAYERAIRIVQEVAKEYGNASNNDLEVVSALPSLYPLQKFEEEAIHKVVASAKNGGWIPCSERLPEEIVKDCLVTLENGAVFQAQYVKYNKEFRIVAPYYGIIRFHEDNPVIAWMELPAPYQKGE